MQLRTGPCLSLDSRGCHSDSPHCWVSGSVVCKGMKKVRYPRTSHNKQAVATPPAFPLGTEKQNGPSKHAKPNPGRTRANLLGNVNP